MSRKQGLAPVVWVVVVAFALGAGYAASIWAEQGATLPSKEQSFRESAWEKLRTWTWKSYTNREYGFMVRFPSHWFLDERDVSGERPEWQIGREGMVFRITLRKGAPSCDAARAFIYMYVGVMRVPLCVGDTDDGLQYILELPHDDLTFSLSCDYTLSLRLCSRLFETFKTLAPQ